MAHARCFVCIVISFVLLAPSYQFSGRIFNFHRKSECSRVDFSHSVRCSSTISNDKKSNGIANKVALVALGCPKNTVDAEVMLGDLKKRGFSIVRRPEDADVGIHYYLSDVGLLFVNRIPSIIILNSLLRIINA